MIDAVKTVLSAFLGIRRRADHDQETAEIKPVHIAIAGVLMAGLLVLTLITIVRFVVA